jgi:hypothetical protein
MASNNSPQAVEVKVIFIEEVVKGRIQADSIFPECKIYQTFRNNPIVILNLIFHRCRNPYAPPFNCCAV